ncbi:sensor domain-containing diguanylate cyclase [Mycolicibacterium pallens]|uniref:Sensor domain-containing diguanylate cyclase n=1 Tax=Mycolicibacterium pallens TaxID=370524 RepID=A0ABX8VPK6_9MYCO|nr:sensor domain-containing diguanylate cyclase [Mycolicibacterium pallens]QYL18023.1 sensor domain-containing diguanylate cyclase [Mycolicibacterium pallens]
MTADLANEATDHTQGMERLLQAVQDLSLARSLADVQAIVRTSARELTGCDGASFVLRDNGYCYYADEDAIAPLWKGSRFPMDSCVSGWAMNHRESVVIPDIYNDERVPTDAYRPTFVKSMVMVPIRKLDPIGAIGNYWAFTRQPTDQEVFLLQALADSTSIAMENVALYSELEQRVRDRTLELEKANEEIHKLLITDELTGLNNRRGFYLRTEAALQAAHRQGSTCVLVFLDVDGLKTVNDEQGHDIGDGLLADVAAVLQSTLRQSDVLARVGGDEFCAFIIDPDCNTVRLRERICEGFDRFNDAHDRPYTLSASIGMVQVPVHTAETETVDELLARADELMYEEKKGKPDSRRPA